MGAGAAVVNTPSTNGKVDVQGMTKDQLVEYAQGGKAQRTQAALELLRRAERRYEKARS